MGHVVTHTLVLCVQLHKAHAKSDDVSVKAYIVLSLKATGRLVSLHNSSNYQKHSVVKSLNSHFGFTVHEVADIIS